jgi:hypothetical protein
LSLFNQTKISLFFHEFSSCLVKVTHNIIELGDFLFTFFNIVLYAFLLSSLEFILKYIHQTSVLCGISGELIFAINLTHQNLSNIFSASFEDLTIISDKYLIQNSSSIFHVVEFFAIFFSSLSKLCKSIFSEVSSVFKFL